MPMKPKRVYTKIISLAFLAMLVMTSCKDVKEPTQGSSVSINKDSLPDDIYTTIKGTALPLLIPGFVQVFLVNDKILKQAAKYVVKP